MNPAVKCQNNQIADSKFSGARWWRFDFHAHTPGSHDFRSGMDEDNGGSVTPEYWLRKFMEAKIDCVAITDHNTGDWIDKLKDELENLIHDQPHWYRPLFLFPAVEISVVDGVHLLAIFGIDKTKSYIDGLLGAVGIMPGSNDHTAITKSPLNEVINTVHQQNGIAIPAHADTSKGLFRSIEGLSIEKIYENPNVTAIEVSDDHYQFPGSYRDHKMNWTRVRGSDMHDFSNDRFGKFTWVKMDSPSIEGLKLALIDGDASVNRDMEANPNQHASFLIESFSVDSSKYIGRISPVEIEFSPFLNSIIGGRGSGKSSLLEFMRLVFRRKGEIPSALEPDSRRYFDVGEDNLLLPDSRLSIVYKKDGTRYRLNWQAQPDGPTLEMYEDGWKPTEGEISSLFPVNIYSQKQIYEMARQPRAVLKVVDRHPDVEFEESEIDRRNIIKEFKNRQVQLEELKELIADSNRMQGVANEIERQIEHIEKSGHKEVLENFRYRQQQKAILENVENEWKSVYESITDASEAMEPVQIDEKSFSGDDDILREFKETESKLATIRQEFSGLSREIETAISDWETKKNKSEWLRMVEESENSYNALRAEMQQRDIDPMQYPLLLSKRDQLTQHLEQISQHEEEVSRLEQEERRLIQRLKENRKNLTDKRKNFLDSVLKENQAVSISVEQFGETWEVVEKEIREILQADNRFDKDFERLKSEYQNNSGDKISALKNSIFKCRENPDHAKDVRFGNHVRNLPLESICDLKVWFPNDGIRITFGEKNQRIEKGSPGQKTAALLSFILSYGKEPLILDQPEDDLDNELIYDLIVKHLRTIKNKRQLIIITHNANIVVNADSEMVFPLKVSGGKTEIEQTGSIQNFDTRDRICSILEGGAHAFAQRYRRIYLEESV